MFYKKPTVILSVLMICAAICLSLSACGAANDDSTEAKLTLEEYVVANGSSWEAEGAGTITAEGKSLVITNTWEHDMDFLKSSSVQVTPIMKDVLKSLKEEISDIETLTDRYIDKNGNELASYVYDDSPLDTKLLCGECNLYYKEHTYDNACQLCELLNTDTEKPSTTNPKPTNPKPTNPKPTDPFSNDFISNRYIIEGEGTRYTICRHPGCKNTIALIGDTAFCETHSSLCLNCLRYCDENALFCFDCIEKALTP